MKIADGSLTDAQFRAELKRCIYCEEKPCQEACPAHCSPADFIMAARVGEKSDLRRSAAMIMGANPLGWVCGVVCPDYFCMKACSRRTFDRPIKIPAVQATVIKKANEVGMAEFQRARPRTAKPLASLAPVPAGLGAASVLAQRRLQGYDLRTAKAARRDDESHSGFPAEQAGRSRGHRVSQKPRRVEFKHGKTVASPEALLAKHDAVIVCAGLAEPIKLNIPGEEYTLSWQAVSGNSKAAENQKQKSSRSRRRRGGGGLRDDGQTPRRCFRRIDLSPPAAGHAADAIRA